MPWAHVDGDAASRRFADAIEAAPRVLFSGGTSISGAIDHAARLLATRSPSVHAPATRASHAVRRVIDISGDGANNRGRPAAMARDDAVAAGIVVNGLPILVLEPDLDRYYRDNVIGGPGAFVVAARTYETFAEAIVRKLVLEIAGLGRPHAALAMSARIRSGERIAPVADHRRADGACEPGGCGGSIEAPP